jgi:hypothetical protein
MATGDEQKAAFRRWAREHHPDMGGDPAVFAAGLEAARAGRWEEFENPPSAPEEPETRTTVYVRKSARGIAKVIVAAQRWNTRRKQPPRAH